MAATDGLNKQEQGRREHVPQLAEGYVSHCQRGQHRMDVPAPAVDARQRCLPKGSKAQRQHMPGKGIAAAFGHAREGNTHAFKHKARKRDAQQQIQRKPVVARRVCSSALFAPPQHGGQQQAQQQGKPAQIKEEGSSTPVFVQQQPGPFLRGRQKRTRQAKQAPDKAEQEREEYERMHGPAQGGFAIEPPLQEDIAEQNRDAATEAAENRVDVVKADDADEAREARSDAMQGNADANQDVADAKAKADYEVAKERCDSLPVAQQDACNDTAEATYDTARERAEQARKTNGVVTP